MPVWLNDNDDDGDDLRRGDTTDERQTNHRPAKNNNPQQTEFDNDKESPFHCNNRVDRGPLPTLPLYNTATASAAHIAAHRRQRDNSRRRRRPNGHWCDDGVMRARPLVTFARNLLQLRNRIPQTRTTVSRKNVITVLCLCTVRCGVYSILQSTFIITT